MQLKKFVLFLHFGLLATTSMADNKTIYGLNEEVRLMNLGGTPVHAKLDTGAVTASLSAVDIELFKKEDGKQWVRFSPMINDKKLAVAEYPVVRIAKIKRRAADLCVGDDEEEDSTDNKITSDRPVIDMDLCLGDSIKKIRVNLTDRSGFDYSLLIGSNALKKFKAIVDPSLKYQSTPNCKAPE